MPGKAVIQVTRTVNGGIRAQGEQPEGPGTCRMGRTNGARLCNRLVVSIDSPFASSVKNSAVLLNGWKDIATYLKCGVRTAQRWEKLGMPVRKPARRGARSPVVALSEELDEWLKHSSMVTEHPGSPESMPGSSGRFRYRILVVDHDEAFLIALAARLAGIGYEIRTARDGFEALAAMRDAIPDLLVSDLQMPNMSGFELLSIVRRRFPATAVIAFSNQFVSAGNPALLCDRYIEKSPNSRFELLEAIRELLSQSPLRSQPAKVGVAPAWLPQERKGYVVLTCPYCLRSFSLMTRDTIIGEDAVANCAHLWRQS